jgi:predicted nucleic acid-binding protein
VNPRVVVVDASLALKWSLPEPHSAAARELLQDWRARELRLLAPALFIYEIASALTKRIRFGELSIEQATRRLEIFMTSGVRLSRIEAHHFRAMQLAAHFGLTAAYDAHYLALAESHQCEFWTADERLWNSVKREFAWVRWIGDETRQAP